MASRAITYVWKIQRPTQEELAQRLMALAYQTAMAADPNATTVLVRYVANIMLCFLEVSKAEGAKF